MNIRRKKRLITENQDEQVEWGGSRGGMGLGRRAGSAVGDEGGTDGVRYGRIERIGGYVEG